MTEEWMKVNRGLRSGQTCLTVTCLELYSHNSHYPPHPPYAPKVSPFTSSQARGYTSNRRTRLAILRWYFFAANSPESCKTMFQPGPFSQRLQRHPLPQDRSKLYSGRPPSSSREEVDRVNGTKTKPWSFRPHNVPLSGVVALNHRVGQSVDIGRSVMLVETLKDMKERGLRPDIMTYNSAMELLGKHALEDEAWALVDDMKALGVMPDIETYKFLLEVR